MLAPLKLTPAGRLSDPALLGERRLGRILEVLNPEGEETRVVGGAVRNALLGLPPGDIDLATTMRPEAVVARARAARLRSIPTGIAHGTVTVLVEGMPFEVTTLREDIETDGRHAVVRFGRDFDADARRRDFTMNALSAGRDGHVFDTVGGVEDLACGHVRFIGDASTRIREDYLRILRFFRFHATYGSGALDPAGLDAAIRNRDGLRRLSRERIRSELFKLLASPGAPEVLRAMDQAGILGLILGQEADVDRLARLVALEPAGDPVLRLAALALRQPADADPLRAKLRLSNAETARLQAAAQAFADLGERNGAPDPGELRTLLFEHGPQASADALRLRGAGAVGDAEAWRTAASFLADTPVPQLPFSGADITARGLKGPAVGTAIAALRQAWAKAGFPNDPSILEMLLDSAVESSKDLSGPGESTEKSQPGS